MTPCVRAGEIAKAAFAAALRELDPRLRTAKIASQVLPPGGAPGGTFGIAVGKAAPAMMRGLAEALGAGLSGGWVVTKSPPRAEDMPPRVEAWLAGHPTPDERSFRAGAELAARVAAVPADGRLVLAVSGGASALVAAPVAGLAPADKVAATGAFMAAGASIVELNALRKHLSSIKGGRLAALARAPLTALILSDVVGARDEAEELSVVGGGLVVGDGSTYADVLASAARLGVTLPPAVRALLEDGARGRRPETPRPADAAFATVRTQVVARPADLGAAAARALEAAGVRTRLEARPVVGPVEDLAAELARVAQELDEAVAADGVPRAFVRYGEPTVRLSAAPGRGGRAQHTALLVAEALAGAAEARAKAPRTDLAVLAVGSDGNDGPTDDAGGLVDHDTVGRAARALPNPVDARRARTSHDAGTFLHAAGALVHTGPTGTNLGDLFLVVAAPR